MEMRNFLEDALQKAGLDVVQPTMILIATVPNEVLAVEAGFSKTTHKCPFIHAVLGFLLKKETGLFRCRQDFLTRQFAALELHRLTAIGKAWIVRYDVMFAFPAIWKRVVFAKFHFGVRDGLSLLLACASSAAYPVAHFDHVDVQGFHAFPRPGSPTQKFQAGRNAGIMREAADTNLFTQLGPAIERHQFVQQALERNPVERIFGLSLVHG